MKRIITFYAGWIKSNCMLDVAYGLGVAHVVIKVPEDLFQ
jgi:hypothetical protein